MHFTEAELRSHVQALAVKPMKMLMRAVNEHLAVAPCRGEKEAQEPERFSFLHNLEKNFCGRLYFPGVG